MNLGVSKLSGFDVLGGPEMWSVGFLGFKSVWKPLETIQPIHKAVLEANFGTLFRD